MPASIRSRTNWGLAMEKTPNCLSDLGNRPCAVSYHRLGSAEAENSAAVNKSRQHNQQSAARTARFVILIEPYRWVKRPLPQLRRFMQPSSDIQWSGHNHGPDEW